MISPSTPSAASWRKKSLKAAVKARHFETFQTSKRRNFTPTRLRLSISKSKGPVETAWGSSGLLFPAHQAAASKRLRSSLDPLSYDAVRRSNRVALLQLGREEYLFGCRAQPVDPLQQ